MSIILRNLNHSFICPVPVPVPVPVPDSKFRDLGFGIRHSGFRIRSFPCAPYEDTRQEGRNVGF